MRRGILVFLAGLPLTALAEPPRLVFVTRAEVHETDLLLDGKLLAGYRHAPSLRKPYLWPVIGPSGKPVMPEHPADHPHHTGLFAAAEVDKAMFWQGDTKDRIRHVRFHRMEGDGRRAVLETECVWEAWADGGHRGMLDDHRVAVFTPLGGGELFIDWQISLRARRDVKFQKVTHMAFPQCRPTIPMSVKGGGGGRITNANGQVNEKETIGKAADWCDYSGPNEGPIEGIAMFSHPRLSAPWHPPAWFTRDYGPFSPNPLQFAEDDAVRRLRKGDELRMRWGILVHRGDVKEGRVAERYAAYVRKGTLDAGD
jgi:hypothetical protein